MFINEYLINITIGNNNIGSYGMKLFVKINIPKLK